MSEKTTAVITFIDADGNKASVYQAHYGHPSGPEGVLMALRPLRHAGAGFDAGKQAAHYIGANWDNGLGLYVCPEPTEVDARFRYQVEGFTGLKLAFVTCSERDESRSLFSVPFDDALGLPRKAA